MSALRSVICSTRPGLFRVAMTRRASGQHYLLMIVCCLESCSAFMVKQWSHTRRIVTAARQIQRASPTLLDTSGISRPIETRDSLLQLGMSVSIAETLTSNRNKTITVAPSTRTEGRRQPSSESEDDSEFEAPAPLVPLVLTLTGKRVNIKWDYVVSTGPVKSTSEQEISKVLVRAGEFTSSLNLKSSRLAEITNMCHPPQFGWDSSDGKGKLNNGSVVPITAPEITTTNAVQNVQKNANISPERRAKMELAAKTDINKPEKMLYEQAISLRKQLLVDKIMKSGYRLKDLSDRFKDNYKSGTSLVSLSQKYDLPPVAIFRDILKNRVASYSDFKNLREKDRKALVRDALKGEGDAWDVLMTDRDKVELEEAKSIDNMSFAEDESSVREASTAWEDSLYAYLDSQNISYVNEKTFKDAGSASTPDCVFLDDCYFNGKLVRWIDMKCFYGTTCSTLFITKLQKQASRYDLEFGGPGAIIYKLGYSENLPRRVPTTLFLDGGPLSGFDASVNSEVIFN